MATTKDKYEDVDFNDLLAQLSQEEIEQLSLELIDPDDTHLPPSDRCRYRTDKSPTGPYDRKALLDFLEKKGREEKDWEDARPFIKEIRGKVYQQKKGDSVKVADDEKTETEWDEALASATEEELVDLAAILGFHGMLNQVQYHQAFVDKEDQSKADGGFSMHAQAEQLKIYNDENVINDTNVEETLQRLQDDDPKLTSVNLNNIKTMSHEVLSNFAEALKTNKNCTDFSMTSVRATDRVAKKFIEMLQENTTLLKLNVESNYISGAHLISLLEAVNVNKTLVELHISNQRPQILGLQREMKIADLLKENHTILKLGAFIESRNTQVKIHELLERNLDEVRKNRVSEK